MPRPIVGVAICLFGILMSGCKTDSVYHPAAGDIVFQTSRSRQSIAIQLATKSPYSHMGIVFLRDGQPFVYEAVGPVKATPLDEWVDRGENGEFVVKRLADAHAVLTAVTLARMEAVGKEFAGRPYDLYFQWSDDALYCSELVWKMYRRGLGIEIGSLESLGAFDVSAPEVRQVLEERWPDGLPEEEPVISPAAMFASDRLVEVYRGRGS